MFLQNEAWLKFSGINWGPRFGTQWYYQRCLLNYAAPGSGLLGKVEWRLDSPTGTLIAQQLSMGMQSFPCYLSGKVKIFSTANTLVQ